jgi:hypothetical protein
MQKKFNDIIKKARTVSLTKKEKAHGRARLSIFLEASVRTEEAGHPALAPIIASLVLVAMLGGGVSLAAENSLPGSSLYPIKVSINEEIRAALATSVEAKAEWETRRAERRLEEGDKLFEKGDLDEARDKKIKEAFNKHAEAAERRIDGPSSESSAVLAIPEDTTMATSAPVVKSVQRFEAERVRLTKIRDRLNVQKIAKDQRSIKNRR